MREFRFHLKYILESIQVLKEYIGGISEAEFKESLQLQDAVIRRMEVIGEAAKRMPDDFRRQYDAIPWRKMAAMRDVLAHDYMTLRLEVIWQTVIHDIIPLETEMEALIEKEA